MLPSEILVEKVHFLFVFFFSSSSFPVSLAGKPVGQTLAWMLKSLTWIEFAKSQPAELYLHRLSQVTPASLAHRTPCPAA